jgi:phosphohistidine phosphatase SixA
MAAGQRPGHRATPRDKRRRRRRFVIQIAVYVVFVIGLAWFFESRLPTTIMFVRHADTESAALVGGDPGLSATGRQRAELLADFIREIDVDASINAIYVTEFRRTQETAAPIANRLGLEVTIADQTDIEGFMADVLDAHRGQIVLIVSHADLIPTLIAEIHGHQSIEPIGADDYDDFFIVTTPHFGGVKTLQLHYGVGWKSEVGGALTSYP